MGGVGHTGMYIDAESSNKGHDAARADNHSNLLFKVSDCAEETIGKIAKCHEGDACDEVSTDCTPIENDTDRATYPVLSKLAGELAVKLTEHHDNNSNSITASSKVTCVYDAKKATPLLLVIAHGMFKESLSIEES